MNRVRRNCPEDITQAMVRERIDYNPETGEMFWRGAKHSKPAGTPVCPSLLPNGYRRVNLLERFYAQHRVAWMYVYGYWPTLDIDHINGDRADNRIANLRELTHAENSQNNRISKGNTTGVKGVSFKPKDNKYQASIRVHGRIKHLGYFATAEEAGEAYRKAKAQFHPTSREAAHEHGR